MCQRRTTSIKLCFIVDFSGDKYFIMFLNARGTIAVSFMAIPNIAMATFDLFLDT